MTTVTIKSLTNGTLVSGSSRAATHAYGLCQNGANLYAALMNGGSVSVYQYSGTTATALASPTTHGSAGVDCDYFNGALRIAYRITDSGSSGRPINFGTLQNSAWSVDQLTWAGRGSEGTDRTPSLTNFGGKMYMVFKRGDHKLGYNWLQTNGKWKGLSGPDIITVNGKNKWTERAPSATATSSHLYVAFKSGSDGLQPLRMVSSSNGKSWSGGDDLSIGGTVIQSSHGPALAAFGDSLIMVYVDSNGNLMQTTFTVSTGSWSTPAALGTGFVASSTPTMSAYQTKAALSFKSGNNAVLYYFDV